MYPVSEDNIEVKASVFSVKESVSTFAFDGEDSDSFTPMTIQGQNKWTAALNDGKGATITEMKEVTMVLGHQAVNQEHLAVCFLINKKSITMELIF